MIGRFAGSAGVSVGVDGRLVRLLGRESGIVVVGYPVGRLNSIMLGATTLCWLKHISLFSAVPESPPAASTRATSTVRSALDAVSSLI